MDFGCALVTNLQPAIAIEPTMCSLYHPPIRPQPLTRLDALAGDARRKASSPKLPSLVPRGVGFVGVQLRGAFPWTTTGPLDGADGVNSFFHHLDVVDIGPTHCDGERDALAFDHKMALRALFAAIRRILPGFCAPPTAGTLAASREARDQSMRSASPRRSSSTWCNFFQTPAACHSLSRRQQVMPEPQPISGGKYSHGSPVKSTKRMPLSTSRFEGDL